MQNFIKSKLSTISQNKKQLIIFTATYAVGFIFGLFFMGEVTENSILYTNANSYYLIIFNFESSFVSLFFNCLLTGALLTLAIILCGLSTFTIPLSCIIFFYRGVVLASALIIFTNLSGISGIIFFIILTLPVHICITLGLIFTSVLFYSVKDSCSFTSRLIQVLKLSFVSLAFTLIASIYLVFLIFIVFRPINSIF